MVAETFQFFGHSYPGRAWQSGQVEPLQIRGWTECSPGAYRIGVLLRNPKTGDRGDASEEVKVPEGD